MKITIKNPTSTNPVIAWREFLKSRNLQNTVAADAYFTAFSHTKNELVLAFLDKSTLFPIEVVTALIDVISRLEVWISRYLQQEVTPKQSYFILPDGSYKLLALNDSEYIFNYKQGCNKGWDDAKVFPVKDYVEVLAIQPSKDERCKHSAGYNSCYKVVLSRDTLETYTKVEYDTTPFSEVRTLETLYVHPNTPTGIYNVWDNVTQTFTEITVFKGFDLDYSSSFRVVVLADYTVLYLYSVPFKFMGGDYTYCTDEFVEFELLGEQYKLTKDFELSADVTATPEQIELAKLLVPYHDDYKRTEELLQTNNPIWFLVNYVADSRTSDVVVDLYRYGRSIVPEGFVAVGPWSSWLSNKEYWNVVNQVLCIESFGDKLWFDPETKKYHLAIANGSWVYYKPVPEHWQEVLIDVVLVEGNVTISLRKVELSWKLIASGDLNCELPVSANVVGLNLIKTY